MVRQITAALMPWHLTMIALVWKITYLGTWPIFITFFLQHGFHFHCPEMTVTSLSLFQTTEKTIALLPTAILGQNGCKFDFFADISNIFCLLRTELSGRFEADLTHFLFTFHKKALVVDNSWRRKNPFHCLGGAKKSFRSFLLKPSSRQILVEAR